MATLPPLAPIGQIQYNWCCWANCHVRHKPDWALHSHKLLMVHKKEEWKSSLPIFRKKCLWDPAPGAQGAMRAQHWSLLCPRWGTGSHSAKCAWHRHSHLQESPCTAALIQREHRAFRKFSNPTGNVYSQLILLWQPGCTRPCQFQVMGKGIACMRLPVEVINSLTGVRVISSSNCTPRQPRMLQHFPSKLGHALLCSLSKLPLWQNCTCGSASPHNRPHSAMKEVPGKILSKTKDDISTITHFTVQNNSGRFHCCSISSQKPAGIPYHQTIPPQQRSWTGLECKKLAKQALRSNPIENWAKGLQALNPFKSRGLLVF